MSWPAALVLIALIITVGCMYASYQGSRRLREHDELYIKDLSGEVRELLETLRTVNRGI